MDIDYLVVISGENLIGDEQIATILVNQGYVLKKMPFIQEKTMKEMCYAKGQQLILPKNDGANIFLSKEYLFPAPTVPHRDLELFVKDGNVEAIYKIDIERDFWCLRFSAKKLIEFLIKYQMNLIDTKLIPKFEIEKTTKLVETIQR